MDDGARRDPRVEAEYGCKMGNHPGRGSYPDASYPEVRTGRLISAVANILPKALTFG